MSRRPKRSSPRILDTDSPHLSDGEQNEMDITSESRPKRRMVRRAVASGDPGVITLPTNFGAGTIQKVVSLPQEPLPLVPMEVPTWIGAFKPPPEENPALHRNVAVFLSKLYNMVSDPENAEFIHWSLDGKSFIVTNIAHFAKDLLPKYFKHANYSSFVRQLNMYDFHKVTRLHDGTLAAENKKASTKQVSAELELMEFAHEYFRKDQPDLLCMITRKRQKSALSALDTFVSVADSSPNISPDLAASSTAQRETAVNAPKSIVKTSSQTSIALNLLNVFRDVAAVKKHTQIISETLRDLEKKNLDVSAELLQARDRFARQQGMIDAILNFLASYVGGQFRGPSGEKAAITTLMGMLQQNQVTHALYPHILGGSVPLDPGGFTSNVDEVSTPTEETQGDNTGQLVPSRLMIQSAHRKQDLESPGSTLDLNTLFQLDPDAYQELGLLDDGADALGSLEEMKTAPATPHFVPATLDDKEASLIPMEGTIADVIDPIEHDPMPLPIVDIAKGTTPLPPASMASSSFLTRPNPVRRAQHQLAKKMDALQGSVRKLAEHAGLNAAKLEQVAEEHGGDLDDLDIAQFLNLDEH